MTFGLRVWGVPVSTPLADGNEGSAAASRPEGVSRGAPFLFEIRVYIGVENKLVL